MGTTAYFEGTVKDQNEGKELHVEIGTTSHLGDGAQMYVNFGDQSMILDHETASQLCDAFARISTYLSYETKNSV